MSKPVSKRGKTFYMLPLYYTQEKMILLYSNAK